MLITAKSFQDFGSSEHVRNINQLLKNMSISQVRSSKMKISKQSAIDKSDYLMVFLTDFNYLRTSNLMNISLQDVNMITKHEEIHDAYAIVNDEYKKSMFYGAKIILLDKISYEQLKMYVEVQRPLVTNDSKLHNQNQCLYLQSIQHNETIGSKNGPLSYLECYDISIFQDQGLRLIPCILFQNKNVGFN